MSTTQDKPLTPGALELSHRHDSFFARTWSDTTPAEDVRFVVFDSETTGLDQRKDRLVSLGAVAVEHGQIIIDDAFEAVLHQSFNCSTVVVHGITREASRHGLPEADALRDFITYARDGVIVGHHIGWDVTMLNLACQRHFGFTLRNRALDTMDLTLRLERLGAFAHKPEFKDFSLDGLCAFFRIEPHDRHTAPGDAFLTAQIFLKLLRLAARHNITRLGPLSEPFIAEGL